MKRALYDRNAANLTFVDYSHLIAEWLKANTH
jgi:hypothetical protein